MPDSNLKSYLLTMDTNKVSQIDATEIIDSIKEIVNWQTLFSESIILVSREELSSVHKILKKELHGSNFVLIALEGAKKNGWLPKSSWNFMNKPTSASDA